MLKHRPRTNTASISRHGDKHEAPFEAFTAMAQWLPGLALPPQG